jgi:hypothetical protein
MTGPALAPTRALLLENIHPTAAEALTTAGFDVERVDRALDGETPHLGYVTDKTDEAFYREAVEDVAAFLGGRPVRVLA